MFFRLERCLPVLIVAVSLLVSPLYMTGYAQSSQDDSEGTEMTQEEMDELLTGLTAAMSGMQEVTQGTFSSDELGYSIDIPQGWSGMFMEQTLVVARGGLEGLMMGGEFDMPPTFVVSVESDQAKVMEPEEVDVNEVKKMIEDEQSGEDVELNEIDVKRDKLNGRPCIKVTSEETMKPGDSSGSTSEIKTRTMTFILKTGGKNYSLTYSAKESDWESLSNFIANHKKSLKFQ